MNSSLKKKQIFLAATIMGLLIFFSYGFYSAMVGVSLSVERYTAKSGELASLEEKQRRGASLEKELAENSSAIDEIKQALIEQTYEKKLGLVIDIENTAKASGLVYELNIVKELTKESIVEEKARLARQRRKSQQIREAEPAEQFPGIVFSVKLTGSYPATIDFIDKLQTLPYYLRIENFNIFNKGSFGEETSVVETNMQVAVFTM